MGDLNPLGFGDTGLFASADFLDAEATRPAGAALDIGGNGSFTPYSDAIQAMVAKHMNEIHGKTVHPSGEDPSWKRRLREFILTKNTDLLDFLKVSVKSHPVLGRAEILLNRFGNPNVSPVHPSVRDMIFDGSGASPYIAELSKQLDAAKGGLSGVDALISMSRSIHDIYIEAGNALLREQTALKGKLDSLDRIQGKLATLLSIDPTESYEPLIKATESFMEKTFRESNFEAEYKALIETYRTFAAAREMLKCLRAAAVTEAEPLCGICLAEGVCYALTPCGHTLCQTCVRKQLSNCFICRGPVKDRVKIYFT